MEPTLPSSSTDVNQHVASDMWTFLEFGVQQYESLNLAQHILHGQKPAVQEKLQKLIFKTVVEIGEAICSAESKAVEEGAETNWSFTNASNQQMSPLAIAGEDDSENSQELQTQTLNESGNVNSNVQDPQGQYNAFEFVEANLEFDSSTPHGTSSAVVTEKESSASRRINGNRSSSQRSSTSSPSASGKVGRSSKKKGDFLCLVTSCKKRYVKQVNLIKHINVKHPNIANGANAGIDFDRAAQLEQQQPLQMNMTNSLSKSNKKRKRPRLLETVATATENSRPEPDLFSSKSQLGDCKSMPDFEAFLQQQFTVNTPEIPSPEFLKGVSSANEFND